MVVNTRPCKRLKRRVLADLCDFRTFPAAQGEAELFGGAFRSNVHAFLTKFARLPPSLLAVSQRLETWQIVFRIGDDEVDSPTVALNVVEEDVSQTRSVYCDHCRVVGWSGHPVCNKRYHFIIRADSSPLGSYPPTCTGCGSLLPSLESRCKSCRYQMTADDLEDWTYLQLENPTHLLHGVIHSNGFGHLLRVNGLEGGSRFLYGSEIMDFWDRICDMLRVREVTVIDVSKKFGLELRLLHAVTRGHPWYGNWGYQFGTGSYAITHEAYVKAVNALAHIRLESLVSEEEQSRLASLRNISSLYSSISNKPIFTVQELVDCILSMLHETRSSKPDLKRVEIAVGKATIKEFSRWTAEEVRIVENALAKVLQVVGSSRWISWRSLRGAVGHGRNPELVNFSLKNLPGKMFGDKIVQSCLNPATNMLEFRLEEVHKSNDSPASTNRPSEVCMLQDLKFVFEALLHPKTMMNYSPQQTREVAMKSANMLLDCKHFVKKYETIKSMRMYFCNPSIIALQCRAELIDKPDDFLDPPHELIVLPVSSTIAKLKSEIGKTFCDVYIFFKHFQIEEIPELKDFDDSTELSSVISSGKLIVARGRCLTSIELAEFLMERGPEKWTVDCSCGARDDDGERMLACDLCGVWQHTRCVGILDNEAEPTNYVCGRCSRGQNLKDTQNQKDTDNQKIMKIESHNLITSSILQKCCAY